MSYETLRSVFLHLFDSSPNHCGLKNVFEGFWRRKYVGASCCPRALLGTGFQNILRELGVTKYIYNMCGVGMFDEFNKRM
jgi:hypothetical protein